MKDNAQLQSLSEKLLANLEFRVVNKELSFVPEQNEIKEPQLLEEFEEFLFKIRNK